MNYDLFHSPHGEDDTHAYRTPLEEKVREMLTPFQEYIKSQVSASVLLLLCTLVALVCASTPGLMDWYKAMVKTPFGIHFGFFDIVKPLQFWVNDFLLTIFFFFVGLEIKREVLVGELTHRKRAAFVLFAAVGGMLMPALIFYLMTKNTAFTNGWGIPMATDTAFALGILTCFRRHLPSGMFTFLAAMAIIDDIGAILVIAIFYSSAIDPFMLGISALLIALLVLLNYSGFRHPFPYLIVGLGLWIAVEYAGVHGTLAGILVAFLIPARPRKGPRQFLRKTKKLLSYFEERKQKNPLILEDPQQHALIEKVQAVALDASTPLQRWESSLELPVALLILPLFALVNAGVPINFHLGAEVLSNAVTLGIIFGLVIGKPLGVLLFSFIARKLNIGELPKNTSTQDLIPVALLTGIGFTMSVFMTSLSYAGNHKLLILAKAAILLASLISASAGLLLLVYKCKIDNQYNTTAACTG